MKFSLAIRETWTAEACTIGVKFTLKALAKGVITVSCQMLSAINIVDFNFPPEGSVHTSFKLRETLDPSLILSNALEIHFINMVKWRKEDAKDIKNNPLHRWLTWFNDRSPSELVTQVVSMDNAINAANERQTYVTQDDEARRVYWSRRKAEHDLISGLNYAREEVKIAIARNLLAEGLTIEFVQKTTGLDKETIQGLSG